jgi:hypothetical protein
MINPPITTAPKTSQTSLWTNLCAPAVDAVATGDLPVSVSEFPAEVAVMLEPPGVLLPSKEPELELKRRLEDAACGPLAVAIVFVPFVLTAGKVVVLPSTTTTVDAEPYPEATEEETVYILPPTVYTPPSPTLIVPITEMGVTVLVTFVIGKLEVSPSTTTAIPEEASEYIVPCTFTPVPPGVRICPATRTAVVREAESGVGAPLRTIAVAEVASE